MHTKPISFKLLLIPFAFCVLIWLLWSCIKGSHLFLQLNLSLLQERIETFYNQKESELISIAESMLSVTEKEVATLYFIPARCELQVNTQDDAGNSARGNHEFSALQESLSSFVKQSTVEFHSIYTVQNDHHLYPDESCVFSCVIMQYDNIYCWVDLVYSPNWMLEIQNIGLQQYMSDHKMVELNPSWYIVLQYGY